jgi:putative tricarboxylic transport membrane protein
LISQNPTSFWGIVAGMYIGNLMLLVLNLPMIGMWVQLLRLPYNVLFRLIILFTIIGGLGACALEHGAHRPQPPLKMEAN